MKGKEELVHKLGGGNDEPHCKSNEEEIGVPREG